jgi:DNA-binding transcriptional MerR regulator
MLRAEIAKKLGLDAETVRFYEKQDMISKPHRLINGYREYNQDHLVELKFIQHCRSLGISLEEIRTLKGIQDQPVDCSQANKIIEHNISLIEIKIRELKNLKSQLTSLSESCKSTVDVKNCAIVKTLKSAAKGDSCICHESALKKPKSKLQK